MEKLDVRPGVDVSNVVDSHIADVDAHEMIPVHMWGEVFGDGGKDFLDVAVRAKRFTEQGLNSFRNDDLVSDEGPMTEEIVWTLRGPGAPSAIDLGRRCDALDLMGIERQLIFPTFALTGLIMLTHPAPHTFFRYDPEGVDARAIGRRAVTGHNEWCIRMSSKLDGGDRVRPVGVVVAESIDQMVAESQQLIDAGIRCVQIQHGAPPAGTSPADTALDPFWSLYAESNVPLTCHIGTEFPFLASEKWGANVPQFAPSTNSTIEFPIQPYMGATLSFAAENWITTLVLGGVFERHPNLRFGMIEVGAQWIGPLAERLDMWAKEFGSRLSPYLSMKPSEYIARNVRVTPHAFEDVASHFVRYPHLADVYCYSSDYPHVEGGKWSKKNFQEQLADFDSEIIRKFFIENGQLLLPT